MNSQMTYTTAQSHRDDLLRQASQAPREPRRASRRGAGSLELRWPRLAPRATFRRVSFALSTFATIAIVALVVTLSTSRAASRTAVTTHAAATTSDHGMLGLVRDPRTHAWMCVRVTHRHYHLAR